MSKFVYFDGRYATIAFVNWDGDLDEITTTAARPGMYVREDRGARGDRQICAGGGHMGATLLWASSEANMGRQLARDVGGRLYKTEATFRAAIAKALTPESLRREASRMADRLWER